MDFTDVRVRLAVTLGVILGCAWLIHPVNRTINLGLDLKGGVHMVMRVRTDDAVKAEVDLARERIRSVLAEKGITAQPASPTAHRAPNGVKRSRFHAR